MHRGRSHIPRLWRATIYLTHRSLEEHLAGKPIPRLRKLSVRAHLTPRFRSGNIDCDGGLRSQLQQRDDIADSGEDGRRTRTISWTTVAADMRVDGMANASWRLARGELPEGTCDIATAEGVGVTRARQDLQRQQQNEVDIGRSEVGGRFGWYAGAGRGDGESDLQPALSRFQNRAGVISALSSAGSGNIARGADAIPGEQFAIWVSGRTNVQFRDVGSARARCGNRLERRGTPCAVAVAGAQ